MTLLQDGSRPREAVRRPPAGLTLTRTDDPERWDRAARASGQRRTPFSHSGWLRVAARATGTSFVPLVVGWRGVDVGTATWLVRRRGPFALVNRMPFPYAGPLVPPEHLAATLAALRRRARWHAVVAEEQQFAPGTAADPAVLAASGYDLRTDQTYVVDTSRGEEALWAGLSRSHRQRVAQAGRSGITLETDGPRREVLAEVMDKVFRRRGSVSPYSSSFPPRPEELDLPGLAVRWVVARRGEEALGSLLTLLLDDVALGWAGGVLPEHRNSHANVVMYWDSIRWAAEHGARSLDLGGVPDAGIGHFKSRFGGDLREYPVLLRVGRGHDAMVAARDRVRALRHPPSAGPVEDA